MIDLPTAEQLRAVTKKQLSAERLPDDNGLLGLLKAAGYLVGGEVTGYLPAALCSYRHEPDAVEVLVDNPLGEWALTQNGGPDFTYEFPHRRLNELGGQAGRILSTDTGHVAETDSGKRYFLPKDYHAIMEKTRHNQISQSAINEECDRLGLDGIKSSYDFIADEYSHVEDLNFTRAIRVAAKWASHTLVNPWDAETQTYYPRTITVDEAHVCLRAALQDLKNETPRWDITIIKSFAPS